MILILGLLSLETDAKEPKILMFLWHKETKAEEGFRDVLAEEFPDQDLDYTVYNTVKDVNRLESLIKETDEKAFDLIYTYGSKVTVKVAESYTKIPIVFNIVFDPIGYEIIESWDQKQPNLTGASNSIPLPLQVKKMQEVFGKGNIGLIYNPRYPQSERIQEDMSRILAQEDLDLIPFEFDKNFRDLRNYLNRIKDQVACIYLPSEWLISRYINRIVREINRRRIPSCVTNKTYLKSRALICISVAYYDVGRMAGQLAIQILNGIKPSNLAVQRPSESDIQLHANSQTLKRLKIQFPPELEVLYIK
jgi:putative ABC transport system substrate-binding protein